MQGTQIKKFPIEEVSTTRKFSMLTLQNKIELVVLVDYEFEFREKLKLKCFLWNFWTIRIVMQGRNNDFLIEDSSTTAVFSIEISMEEIELVVAEN